MSHPQTKVADTVVVMVHRIAVTEPIRARTKAVSKALAAELALRVLEDESSAYHLPRLCDCNINGSEVKPRVDTVEDEEGREDRGDEERDEEQTGDPVHGDETEEGFAALAQRLAGARKGRSSETEACRGESDMDISEDEVDAQ